MKSQPKRAFHIASEPEIKAGEVSDVYFDRTVEILRAKGLNKRVKAEIRLRASRSRTGPSACWPASKRRPPCSKACR
jgi:hypothetical protein